MDILEFFGAPEGFKTCPLPMVPKWWAVVSQWTRSYSRGILPFPGAVSEQPAGVMDVLHTTENAWAEFRIELAKKRNKNTE